MTTDELLDAFRLDIDDVATPPLWSDTEAYGYMDEAQKMFCRLTEGIEDARTASVCTLAVVAGTDWYPKSKLIRKVRSAARADNGRAVAVLSPENPAMQGIEFAASKTGAVKAVIDGLSDGYFRIYPMPSETVDLNLTVFRLPLVKITDDGGQEFEIYEEHVPFLLLWMKHRAYGKHDADTFDAKARDENEARFRSYCRDARVEQERKRRQTGVTVYGGLPMSTCSDNDYFNRW